ncbi:MAG TPA: topoisomerase C-terminal repeat-containing protein, partial [Steroidobacteraceae bacterium]|nr:topoisomerase C-terminal repeat-containing protein [Steroidobacteraceae bacterium]
WTTPLEKFWKPFIRQVERTDKNVSREEVVQARELGKDPASGKPVSVRMGRYGPFVQIGTKDDVEKPRFAGLRPGQKMDAIGLADALELFKLPRALGQTEAGEPIVANVGRFGPYVKYGEKYVSLREDDPYTITLERALEVIRLKQQADANRTIADHGDGIRVLNGRYGPYITDGKKNAKVPKDRDPKSLTLEECRELIALAPERGRGRFGRRAAGKAGNAGKAGKAGNGANAAGGTEGTTAPKAPPAKARPTPAARGAAPGTRRAPTKRAGVLSKKKRRASAKSPRGDGRAPRRSAPRKRASERPAARRAKPD